MKDLLVLAFSSTDDIKMVRYLLFWNGKFVKMIESRNSLGIILNESSLIFFLQFNENLMTLMSFNGFVFLQGL